LSLVEFRVLKLICNGYSLAKEIVKGYTSKYGEAISLQAIERILAKLRNKRLVNSKHSGRALAYEETQLGKALTC
jgi:predicted transcriptional regulator